VASEPRTGGNTPAELARRIGNGDRGAEEELVRHFRPRLEFILRGRLNDAAQAADLTHEALLIVLERLRGDGLDDPGRLAAFLHRTALNLIVGEARKHYRRNTHNDDDAVAAAAAVQPLIEDQIDRERLADAIRRLLGELKQPRDRQILRRFYLTEEPKASICKSLDVTPEHFDRVLYRARKRFGEILARELPDNVGGSLT